MRYIFTFPDIGEGLDEGTIAEWYVQKGEEVEMGQPLVKMETDKVVTDIPSPKTGMIAALYGRVGETIHVGSPLVEIDIPGIDGEAAIKEAAKPDFEAVEEGAGVVGTLEVAGNSAWLPSTDEVNMHGKPGDDSGKPAARKVLATPVARAMAREFGIDINLVVGTGPAGRVTRTDIEKQHVQVDKESDTQPLEIIPLTQMRKAIARNMIQSKHQAAHMTVFDEVEVSELVRIRNRYKKAYNDEGINLSFLPFILKAVALALKAHPVLNSEMDMEGGRLILKKYYHLGIAVDTDDGLVVPVIHHADRLTIRELAIEVGKIADKARKRALTLDDMKGGTFTLTNFGSIGGQHAVPVINYPQAAILGIGRMQEKPVVKNGAVVPGTLLPLSVSVDHRIVDGGEVARFVNRMMGYLADPVSLIMD